MRITKKLSRTTRKRIQIVALWLVFLAAFGVAAFHAEYKLCDERAQVSLARQAKNVSLLLPTIRENDRTAAESIARVMPVRMRALAIGLEKYETIEDATPFLKEFSGGFSIEELTIRDAQGRVVYGDAQGGTEETEGGMLSGTATVGNRWALSGRMRETSTQKAVRSFYSWQHTLELMTVEAAAKITAVSLTDGTILLSADPELIGRSMAEADIRPEGGDAFTDAGELDAFFTASEETERLRIGGVSCLATEIGDAPEEALLILTLSEEEVRAEAWGIVSMIWQIMALVSGLYVVYAFFFIRERTKDDSRSEEEKGWRWNRNLAQGMTIGGVLVIVGVLVFHIYTAKLSSGTRTFMSNRAMAENAANLYSVNQNGMDLARDWSDDEYLTRARMTQVILAGLDREEMTRPFLARLAEALELQEISVYDADGFLQVNSTFAIRPNIEKDSPFYVLLQGRNDLIGTPGEDGISGSVLRQIGVSLRDENGLPDGCILVSDDLDEPRALSNTTRYDYLFRQLTAPFGTIFGAAEGEGNEIVYLGTVQEDGYDEYTGEKGGQIPHTLKDFGLKEEQIRDGYNGNTEYRQEKYILSVRENGEDWIFFMQPLQKITWASALPAIRYAMILLLFCAVLLLICCLERKENAATQTAQQETAGQGEETDTEHTGNILTRLENILYVDKLYFEDRWPEESRKWKDKSAREKFRTVLKMVFLFFQASIFLFGLSAGENSMLAICFRGEWSSGFNLFSLTTVMITVCWLLTAKIIIHRLLYVLARAATPKGETICHLLNSFSGYLLAVIGVFISLVQLGVNLTNLSLTAGVLGVIFSIGCQSIVTDILAGILMTFEGVIHAGDMVSVEDYWYYVIGIGVRSTKLKSEGRITIIRNDDFKNYVTAFAMEKISVVSGFYANLTESAERMEEIVMRELPAIHDRLCEKWPDVEGPYYRGIDEVTDSWMNVTVYIMCDVDNHQSARRQLNAEILKMCERNNISLAMPQIVVHEAVNGETR